MGSGGLGVLHFGGACVLKVGAAMYTTLPDGRSILLDGATAGYVLYWTVGGPVYT